MRVGELERELEAEREMRVEEVERLRIKLRREEEVREEMHRNFEESKVFGEGLAVKTLKKEKEELESINKVLVEK